MNESLDIAVNSLNEQTKKINIALFYTSNDMEKSKQMVAGTYKDLIVLKLKFTSSSIYGAILAFLNTTQYKFIDSFVVVSNDYLIDNISNSQDWRTFEKDIQNAKATLTDFRLLQEIKEKFDKGFTTPVCSSVIQLQDKNDTIQLSRLLQKMLQDTTGLQRVDISVDFQKISSLEMELDSILSRKIDSKIVSGEAAQNEEPKPLEVVAEGEPKPGENGIKAIIRSSLILSPIKGKPISDIKMGDRVLVSLVEMNDQSRAVAKAFNAFNAEENRILPIPARIKSMRYIEGTGFKIYVVIAKGILGSIIEEDKRIKVAMDPTTTVELNVESEHVGGSSLSMIIILVSLIIMLVGFIIYAVV